MIDNIYSQFYQHPNIGIACLYADFKDQTNQVLVHILGSFLRQLLTTSQEPIPEKVIQKLLDIRRLGGKVGVEDNLAFLKILLHQLKCAFICIDAIDELEPQVLRQLLKVLRELSSNSARLFLTGRDHIRSEIEKFFQTSQSYATTISASQHDIQEFVRQQIADDPNEDAMDKALEKDTIDAIVKKSDGMWVLKFEGYYSYY